MILEFNDEDSFEKAKFKRAVTADDAYACLWDVNECFCRLLNGKLDELDEAQYEFVAKVAKRVGEIYEEKKIDLDVLM